MYSSDVFILKIHLVFIACYPLSHLFVAEANSWHKKERQNEHLRRLAAQTALKRDNCTEGHPTNKRQAKLIRQASEEALGNFKTK